MKLNYNCMREILLYLEENLVLDDNLCFVPVDEEQIFDTFARTYEAKEIRYSIINLSEAGFLECYMTPGDNTESYQIIRITYAGHEFLNTIKNDKVWTTTLEAMKKFGSQFTLDLLKNLAFNITQGMFAKLLKGL